MEFCNFQSIILIDNNILYMMISVKPTTLLNDRFDLAEGPMYFDQSYYWVDIEGKFLHQLRGGIHASLDFRSRVTSVIPCGSEELLVSLDEKLVVVKNLKNVKEFEVQIPLAENTRFNDAKVDPWGNYWVGSMDLDFASAIGSLYCIKPDGQVIEMLKGVTCSNGLAWDSQKNKFYYIDSVTQKIVAYDFDPVQVKITNEQVVYRELRPQVYPDGMCIDADGNLWLALWGGAEILKINPGQSCVEEVLSMPCPNVTSCCFAGENLDELVVTTASRDTDLEKFPQAGSVFKFKLGGRGMPVNCFEGNI